MFFLGSRYADVEEQQISDNAGRTVRYKTIRFIPETRAQTTHHLDEGERLDHIAFRYYRDPERFWRICDANRAMWPDDLITEPGRTILVPPPEA